MILKFQIISYKEHISQLKYWGVSKQTDPYDNILTNTVITLQKKYNQIPLSPTKTSFSNCSVQVHRT